MGWVGEGGGPNNIGGAFELSLAGLSNLVSLNGGMTVGNWRCLLNYPLAGDSLPKTVTRYDGCFFVLHAA